MALSFDHFILVDILKNFLLLSSMLCFIFNNLYRRKKQTDTHALFLSAINWYVFKIFIRVRREKNKINRDGFPSLYNFWSE